MPPHLVLQTEWRNSEIYCCRWRRQFIVEIRASCDCNTLLLLQQPQRPVYRTLQL